MIACFAELVWLLALATDDIGNLPLAVKRLQLHGERVTGKARLDLYARLVTGDICASPVDAAWNILCTQEGE